MNRHISRVLILSTTMLASSFVPVWADQLNEEVVITSDNFMFVGGIGYTWLEGNELVYDDAGNRISHLMWETNAPVINLGAKGVFGNDWTVSGNARFGFSGNSHMEDYDWLGNNYDFDNWTDQSIHSDTELDRYINLDIALGKNFALNDVTDFNLHGGFKYSNVKWTAYGGSFTYSNSDFRDSVGNFPDGERGITFEQRYPGVFIGGEAKTNHGAWTFTGLARVGVTIGAKDIDHHWMRDLRFEDKFGAIPFVNLGLEAAYQVNEKSQITLGVDFERFFQKKGNTKIYNISDGVQVGNTFENGAGMSFQSVTITAGLKVSF